MLLVDASINEVFSLADKVSSQLVQGISDLIQNPGTVNLDFDDVKTVMSQKGSLLMGVENAADKKVHLIFGASINEELGDEIIVTVIATGFDEGCTTIDYTG